MLKRKQEVIQFYFIKIPRPASTKFLVVLVLSMLRFLKKCLKCNY